ncbi:MAG: Crp/Fnr family transcriptional regulator [Chitinophagia bacterium]|jgi:CRP-like cAMP-binding protein|nr:Crp/Fnr family transcriptional regulator [Chitinophagia bacterium]
MQFFETGIIKTFNKGTILLREGEVCRFGCKVISGCLKSYVVDRSGKEHIIQFAPEDWIITDMESLFNQTPSSIYIEAIEDTQVHWIQKDMVQPFEKANNEDLLIQIKMLTRNIITSNKRTRMLLSSTGEERYRDFLKTYPALAQRLPLKLIASYIGITPEYLSEIRRKVAGK